MLYGCETWTLTEDLERKIIAFEKKSCRHVVGIEYREHNTNVFVYITVYITVEEIVGETEYTITTIKRRKLSYFGHAMKHDSLQKTIGKRRRGRPRKDWNSNICKWSGISQREVLGPHRVSSSMLLTTGKMEKGMHVLDKSCPPYDQQVKGLSK